MIDDELMELIQRDLDGDLTREEREWLQRQLQANPAAQLMYERLKRVSNELASLPPVTPRYSLVDAILPELEATRMEQAAMAVPAEPAVRPAIPLLHRKEESRTTEKTRRLPLWMVKAGAGAVAASLFVGIWFASQSPIDQTGQGSSPVIQELSSPPQPKQPEPSVPLETEPDNGSGETVPPITGESAPPVAPSDRQPTPNGADSPSAPSAGDSGTVEQSVPPAASDNPLPSSNRPGQSPRPEQSLQAQPDDDAPQDKGADQKDEKKEQDEEDDEKKEAEKKGQVKPDKGKETDGGGSSDDDRDKVNEKEKDKKDKENKGDNNGNGNGKGNGNKSKEKSANTKELPLPSLDVTLD